jgi:hypothetical protein
MPAEQPKGEPLRVRPGMKTDEELQKYRAELMAFGTAAFMVQADGSVTHVPLSDVLTAVTCSDDEPIRRPDDSF